MSAVLTHAIADRMREASDDGDVDKCTHKTISHHQTVGNAADPSNGTDVNTCSLCLFFFFYFLRRLSTPDTMSVLASDVFHVWCVHTFRRECVARLELNGKRIQCSNLEALQMPFDEPFQHTHTLTRARNKEKLNTKSSFICIFNWNYSADTFDMVSWSPHAHTSYFIDSIWSSQNDSFFFSIDKFK